jgi:hypothetical protein
MLEPLTKKRQQLLYQEERASDVRGKEAVKILDRVLRNACRLANSGVEYKHIQSIADDGVDLLGKQRSAVRSF